MHVSLLCSSVLILSTLREGNCSILQDADRIKSDVAALDTHGRRYLLDDASFRELETIQGYFEQAQRNLVAFAETQQKLNEALNARTKCGKKTTQNSETETIAASGPWEAVLSDSMVLDDAFVGSVGLPQRLVYFPTFLKDDRIEMLQDLVRPQTRYASSLAVWHCWQCIYCRSIDWTDSAELQRLVISAAQALHLPPSNIHHIEAIQLEASSSHEKLQFMASYVQRVWCLDRQ